MRIAIDTERVLCELAALAEFSEAEAPAVTRIVFTQQDIAARAWIIKLCADAGLVVREDAVGNTFARWSGFDESAPAVATGSHIDAIPNAGRYDGTVGVLGALEAIRALEAGGFKPRAPIDLILFTSEEPTRFGLGCLGSRLLSGTLPAEQAAALCDADGRTLDDVRQSAGFRGELSSVKLARGYYRAFVELHIEQGPNLEHENKTIGVVTHIAAPASLRIFVQGEGGHAGGVLMPNRRDALLGAAEIALAVEAAALATGSRDSVATTGVCQVSPGAINSIPNLVKLEIDVRDTDLKRRDSMIDAIQSACEEIAAKRRIAVAKEILNADAPAECDPKVVAAIVHACETTRQSFLHLVSRAYHDALFLSRLAPTGMIFIPCRGGISHRPDEYAAPEHIAAGIEVLAHTLAELAS